MSNQPLPPKLAFPCPKRWDEMHATGSQQRFCDQCQLHVHDLSALTVRQGERLLARSGGQTCVSFVTGPDGLMLTRSRWQGLARGWRGVRQATLAFLTMLTPFAFVSCSHENRGQGGRTLGRYSSPPQHDGQNHRMTGAIAPERTVGTPMPNPPSH